MQITNLSTTESYIIDTIRLMPSGTETIADSDWEANSSLRQSVQNLLRRGKISVPTPPAGWIVRGNSLVENLGQPSGDAYVESEAMTSAGKKLIRKKFVANGDGTHSQSVASVQAPVAGFAVSVPINSTVTVKATEGRVYGIVTSLSPIEILDGTAVVWIVRSASNSNIFFRPLLNSTNIKLRNPSLTTAADVHIQYD